LGVVGTAVPFGSRIEHFHLQQYHIASGGPTTKHAADNNNNNTHSKTFMKAGENV
jgi:hypothetical protein